MFDDQKIYKQMKITTTNKQTNDNHNNEGWFESSPKGKLGE